jgi:hypothetical protein
MIQHMISLSLPIIIIFSLTPSFSIAPLRLSGELIVRPVSHPTTTPSVSLLWQPSKELLSGYSVDLLDLDIPSSWRTITKIPAAELGYPFPGVTVSGLIPGHSYRFRVIPYKDDAVGQPIQSTSPFTVSKVDESSELARIRIPPPQGSLHVEHISPKEIRLSWLATQLPLELDTGLQKRLKNNLEYVIEQRLPEKRMWYEVGRTRMLDYTVPLDTTSQFRVRTVLAESPEYDAKYPYIVSTDGLISDWIVAEEEDLTHEFFNRPRRGSADVEVEIGHIVPDQVSATHVGKTTAFLEWTSAEKKILKPKYGYLLIEKRTVDEKQLGPWEPVVEIPATSVETGYEVYGLRPGTKYDFRVIGVDTFSGVRSTKIARMRSPVITQGISIPVGTPRIGWLSAPEHVTAHMRTSARGDGIHLKWHEPEVVESVRPRIRYRLEARLLDSSGSAAFDWTRIITGLNRTDHFIEESELDQLVAGVLTSLKEGGRPAERDWAADFAKRRWQFRVIALCDDVESAPATVNEPVTLLPLSSKSYTNLK